ncbi:uncharacterized protein LOC112589540 [Harpegnathos saltator]|uniref:uncharacterized protein LOC112589540 n=1 Tax=Harpegnathos saltator TaxID=610380 RepID=UPI000DBEE2DC|nr:uncharacterized protein LOC112589540 [Harpegnathos saltator]
MTQLTGKWAHLKDLQLADGSDKAERTETILGAECAQDDTASLLRHFWEVEEVPVASILSEEERACEEFFTTDYTQQGHVVRLPLGVEQPRPSYFMPHHPIIKRAPDPRVRVVFNASQVSTNGRSLNDLVHVGLHLQLDLGKVLLAWRMHRVAFIAGIEQMFRQIRVAWEDQHLQQILWRDSQTQLMGVYRLATVTYGTACALYLAIRILLQLALDEEKRYPRAAELLRRQTYVDDILARADSLEEARQRQCELRNLLMAGRFCLRKRAASQSGLLSDVPKGDQEPLISLPDPGTVGVSVLEYDPMGWLTPIVVVAKILLQDLWLAGLDWDEALPLALARRWDSFRSGVTEVSRVRVSRWTGSH